MVPSDPARRPTGRLLRSLLDEYGLRIRDLIERTGLPRPTVSRHVNGHTMPSYADRRRYAAAFGLDIEQFESRWRGRRIDTSRGDPAGGIPVINRAPAGQAFDYEEYGIDSGIGFEYLDRGGLDEDNLFAVVIIGDSMEPRLHEGDHVIFQHIDLEREPMVDDGDIVFVRFEPTFRDGCMVAALRRLAAGHVRLQKFNPNYPHLDCRRGDLRQLAVAIERRERFKRPRGPRLDRSNLGPGEAHAP